MTNDLKILAICLFLFDPAGSPDYTRRNRFLATGLCSVAFYWTGDGGLADDSEDYWRA